MEKITSVANPRIKNIKKLLTKAKERKEQNLFVFEGARELSLASVGGYDIHSVYVVPKLFAKTDYPDVLDSFNPSIIFEISDEIFSSLAYREDSDGLIVLARPQKNNLKDLSNIKNPFFIALESIEKPGNLGAILRTADAAAVDAVIVCNPTVDVYNANVIRSSVGCIFTVPVIVCTSQEAYDYFSLNNISIFAARLQTDLWYQDADYTIPSVIVMGTEAEGLSQFWIDNNTQNIKIPMRGKIDSLNVSVSTAIITFEAMRQRKFLK